jgi:hypothetical protein
MSFMKKYSGDLSDSLKSERDEKYKMLTYSRKEVSYGMFLPKHDCKLD